MTIQLTYPDGCAIVAGGTGNVGAGVTRRLAEAGLPVTFTYVANADRALALEAKLRGEGLKVWARQMDMGDPASIDSAIAFAQEQGGRLHTVTCTAGARVPFNTIADFDIATVERFFDTDAMAYYRLVHQAVPVLRAGGGGSITLCTTIALTRCIAFDGISPFSKGAVDALVRQVAWEEGRNKIRCNAVPISWIAPYTAEEIDAAVARMAPPENERAAVMVNHIKSMIRMPGPGKPEMAGDLFAFLASDQASFLTGQSITVDGGITL
jgi:NAD(P)-dependent dehydrogenase (short-subunit alcohol dehydrogenase family)